MDATYKVGKSMTGTTSQKIKRLNFMFRWDAGKNIGNGHFMRCLVLSTELLKRGHEVSALCRQIPSHLQILLTNLGIKTNCISLESNGLSELSEASEIRQIDWLVIDHYSIEATWENEARRFVTQIMVIDDLANRHHNCDLLLDQNVPNNLQENYIKLVPKHCVKAIGWKYLLARSSFYSRRRTSRTGTLIFLGGGDHSNALTSLLEQMLCKVEYHPLRVLISSDYLPLAHWQSMIGDCGQVHCDLVDPASLYLSASSAVVRCGFISYELALLGIPAVHIYKSAVQAEVSFKLARLGMGVALEERQLVNSELLHTALKQVSLMNPNPLNEQLSPGASVVAELLEQTSEHQ